MRPELIDFAQAIADAEDRQTAWTLLMHRLDAFGFALAKYGFAPMIKSRLKEDLIFLGGFHPELERFYCQGDYLQHDYTARHMILREDPLPYQRLYQKIDAGEITGQTAKGHLVGRDLGMRNGIAIPLRDRLNISRGGISLVAKSELTVKEFNEHLHANSPRIIELVNTFHDVLRRPLLLNEHQQLSRREQECLLWTTRGLRAKQIADTLGTHRKTVEKQLASARQKMNAKNNTEASVKAIVMGLITP